MLIIRKGINTIIKKKKTKERKEEVREYYIANDLPFEIIVTFIPPKSTQFFHKHEIILEVIFVLKGQITAFLIEEKKVNKVTLSSRDIIVFHPGIFHTIANETTNEAEFITIKISPNQNTRVFSKDKIELPDNLFFISK